MTEKNNDKTSIKIKIRLKKMRKVRRELRINQTMVAEFLGVTTQYVSLLERGENMLSYNNALKIAKFFNTTPDDLFKEDFLNANIHLKELEERGY